MTSKNAATAIKNKAQLVEYFEHGCKLKQDWGIGTEHEKFLYHKDNLKRLSYNDTSGIKDVLEYHLKHDWEPIFEKESIIGLKKDGASITLEPGGQYELSGRNFKTIHETYAEAKHHFDDLKIISNQFNVVNLALGFDPLWERNEIDWMPKERYQFMSNYMPKVGSKGIDMMKRTATIQTNLDYSSEQDMIDKMRVAQSMQPIVTAIFANSPFTNGKPNGYLSYRSVVWDYTDADRCGFLPFIFHPNFGFERWVDYLLTVPMYFLYREGKYIDVENITFGEFLQGKTAYQPLMSDWETHLSTVFPDVRLKQFIELRGADASCCSHISALSAFWVGLLYSQETLEEALDYTKSWKIEEIRQIRAMVTKNGLKTKYNKIDVWQTARDILKISEKGLAARAKAMNIESEAQYLNPVKKIIETGKTQAEQLLEDYYRKWNQNILQMVRHHC